MRLISFLKLCIVMVIIHITLGDLFLPEPYRQNSKQLRDNINNYIVSLLPERKILDF